MDSSNSSLPYSVTRRCTSVLLRPWMILCCVMFLLSLLLGLAALFSPEWAVKKSGTDYVGLLRSCSESFGCFDTPSIWCLPDRNDSCETIKVRIQLVLLFCFLGLFLSLSGVVFSFPIFAPCVLVMGVGISVLTTLSYLTSVILFMTIDRHFFLFSTFEDPAALTYGFYLCVFAAAFSLSASLLALKATHSYLAEMHKRRQGKGF